MFGLLSDVGVTLARSTVYRQGQLTQVTLTWTDLCSIGTALKEETVSRDPVQNSVILSLLEELMEMLCRLHSSELRVCIMPSCVALSLPFVFWSLSLSDSDSDSELSVDEHSSSYASSHSSDSEDDDMDIKPKWNNERPPLHSTPKGSSIKGSHPFLIQNTAHPNREPISYPERPWSHCSESTAVSLI